MEMQTVNTNKHFISMNEIFQCLSGHLATKGRVKIESEKFSALKSNTARVSFAYDLLDDNELFPKLLEDCKDDELANELRTEGNKKFKLKNIEDALEFYTRSIAFAQNKSKSLALAFANRSAVLFEKGLYEECLADIARALENNYPEDLKPKLLKRQERANELKSQQVPKVYFQKIPEIPENYQNERIQCASDSVDIKYTENFGRHIIATKDINTGDILAVEKPFCQILVDNFFCHCHACLQLCYNTIPCMNCTQVLYCSEACKDNALRYHKYECGVLKTIRGLKFNKLTLLAMKLVVNIKEKYAGIETNCDLSENDIYRSDRYKEIHTLVGNTEARTVADLFVRSAESAVIYHLMRTYTNFFDKDEEELIFKELILLHLQTAPCNFHEISELAENEEGFFHQEEIGAGAYAFFSLFNHSCSPNVIRYCYGSVIVLRAIESIKQGEQCFDNYGYHYALMTKSDRRHNLRKQYFFECNCQVCDSDWPLYTDLPLMELDIDIDLDIYLERLQKGDVDFAKEVISELLPKMSEIEKLQKPNKNLANIQEVLKQCFSLLGNVKPALKY